MARTLTQSEFREQCRRAFRYLVTDFGFNEQPETVDEEPYIIRFANDTTLVTVVGTSFGSGTELYIDHAGAALDDGFEDRYGYNLRDLLALRKMKFPIAYYHESLGILGGPLILLARVLPGKRFRLQHDQRLQIPVYAETLKAVAADILRGDLTVLTSVPRPQAQPPRDITLNISLIGAGFILIGRGVLQLYRFGSIEVLREKLFVAVDRTAILNTLGFFAGLLLVVAVDPIRKRRSTARSVSSQ